MIRLRELEKIDLPMIHSWRNDEQLIAQLGSPFRYISHEIDAQWFESYLKNRHTQVRCAICLIDSDEIVGTVNLTSIDAISRSAEFSIMIGNNALQNKGIGKEATKQMLHHAFHNLNLHRIYLTVLESNTRAQHVYETVGFTREGVMRQAWYKNGRYHDVIMMGILKDEFESFTKTGV